MNKVAIADCYVAKHKSSKKRNIEFSMSFASFANLKQQTHCAYSGIELTSEGTHMFSFERIDNAIGYVDGNVIAVSRAINTTRGGLNTPEEVDARVEKLINDKQLTINADQSAKDQLVELVKRFEELSTDKEICLKPRVPARLVSKWVYFERTALSSKRRKLEEQSIISKQQKLLNGQLSPKQRTHESGILRGAEERLRKCVVTEKNNAAAIENFKRKLEVINSNNPKVLSHKIQVEQRIKCLKKQRKENIRKLESINLQLALLAHVKVGLKKFQNLSRIQKAAIELGLPVDTSAKTVLTLKLAQKIGGRV